MTKPKAFLIGFVFPVTYVSIGWFIFSSWTRYLGAGHFSLLEMFAFVIIIVLFPLMFILPARRLGKDFSKYGLYGGFMCAVFLAMIFLYFNAR